MNKRLLLGRVLFYGPMFLFAIMLLGPIYAAQGLEQATKQVLTVLAVSGATVGSLMLGIHLMVTEEVKNKR